MKNGMIMKKNWVLRCAMRFGLVFGLSFLGVSSAFADFAVRDEYGNGQNIRFRTAVEGGDPLYVDKCDVVEEIDMPEKVSKRFYGRIRLNKSTLNLCGFRNVSKDPILRLESWSAYNTSATQTGLEVAVGYVFEPTYRLDIEYLVNKTITVNAAPTIALLPSRSVRADIKNNAILANFYYDFTGFSRFEPYVTVGLGLSFNSAKSTLSVLGTTSTRTTGTVDLATAAGVGLRIGFLAHWYLDMAYRYIGLGCVNISPTPDLKLRGKYSMHGFSAGLIYLF